MRTGKKLLVVLAALFIAFLIATAAVWGLSIRQRNRAQAFMNNYVRLKLGTTSFLEAQGLARTYEGIPWYVTQGNMRCTSKRCVFAFKFENKSLSYFHLAHYTGLFAFVSVREGVITARQLEYERSSSAGYEFRYLVFDSADDSPDNHLPLGTTPQVDSEGIPRTVLVRLGSESPETERQRAYSLDLGCLAKFYNCRVPSSYFPLGLLSEGKSEK